MAEISRPQLTGFLRMFLVLLEKGTALLRVVLQDHGAPPAPPLFFPAMFQLGGPGSPSRSRNRGMPPGAGAGQGQGTAPGVESGAAGGTKRKSDVALLGGGSLGRSRRRWARGVLGHTSVGEVGEEEPERGGAGAASEPGACLHTKAGFQGTNQYCHRVVCLECGTVLYQVKKVD